VDATAEGGGDAGSSPSGQSSGCGCKIAQAKEDAPSSTFLAFGGLGFMGVLRLRRRKKG